MCNGSPGYFKCAASELNNAYYYLDLLLKVTPDVAKRIFGSN